MNPVRCGVKASLRNNISSLLIIFMSIMFLLPTKLRTYEISYTHLQAGTRLGNFLWSENAKQHSSEQELVRFYKYIESRPVF